MLIHYYVFVDRVTRAMTTFTFIASTPAQMVTELNSKSSQQFESILDLLCNNNYSAVRIGRASKLGSVGLIELARQYYHEVYEVTGGYEKLLLEIQKDIPIQSLKELDNCLIITQCKT